MIPTEGAHLQIAAQSHPGLSGKNNEDRYAVSAYHLKASSTPALLCVVADGIGGHRAGEVAAEITVDTISRVVAASDAHHPIETLKSALIQASQAIHAQSEADFSQTGMGATCACAWVIQHRLYIASVGDSRIYLIRDNTIRQITRDHTWIQEAIDHGALTPEQARNHPNQHVIRRYLGSKQAPMPDVRLYLRANESPFQAERNQGMTLHPDDRLLLCSDGLTDLVGDQEIFATLKSMALVQALEHLTGLANQRGGHDNITLVAMRVPQKTGLVSAARLRRALLITCLGLAFLLLVALLSTLYLGWYFTRPLGPPF